jgi:hypothetical protein
VIDVTNDDPRLAEHGVCSMREEQELYRTFVPDVFLPGLRAVGVPVDTGAALAASHVMSKMDACGNASGRCTVPARTT